MKDIKIVIGANFGDEGKGKLTDYYTKNADNCSAILPIEDMECYEDIDNKIPSYFQGRVVSLRFAQRNWVKIAIKAKWLHELIDDETGPESDYIECEKNFSILLSTIGKTVFLTREEAAKKLEEMKHE